MIKLLFIDEGFGTQDPESVAVVLKRCNRFIKRIELLELFRMLLSCKNEFRSINVFKDEEKGSVVSEN
jgi:exonuclease SbcC